MANIALVKPEWLEIINCCSPKVQMDLVRAIVAWQTDGTMPDFRGVKKALFLMLVHDLAEESIASAAEIDTSVEDAVVPEVEAEDADVPEQTSPDHEQTSEAADKADVPMETTTPPANNNTAPRRHGGRSSFYPYRRLY